MSAPAAGYTGSRISTEWAPKMLEHPHRRAHSAAGYMAANAQKANGVAAQSSAAHAAAAPQQMAPNNLPLLQAMPIGAAAAAAPPSSYSMPQQPNLEHLQKINSAAFHLLAAGLYQAQASIQLSDGRFVTISISPPTQQS
jgi:hypothetical protein